MLKLPRILAQFGLAFCFVSFGVWEIARPSYWVSYIPDFAAHLFDPALMVRMHGAALLITGLMVLFGILRRFSTTLAVLIMLEIIVSLLISSGFTEIFVRDITILFLAIALMVDAWHRDQR